MYSDNFFILVINTAISNFSEILCSSYWYDIDNIYNTLTNYEKPHIHFSENDKILKNIINQSISNLFKICISKMYSMTHFSAVVLQIGDEIS